MKKMLKRLCTGFLALATVVTALPTTPVHAESKQYWTESAERVGIIEKVMNDGSIGSTFNEGYMKVEGETAYCIDINTDFKNGYKTRADASSRMSADQISDVALSLEYVKQYGKAHKELNYKQVYLLEQCVVWQRLSVHLGWQCDNVRASYDEIPKATQDEVFSGAKAFVKENKGRYECGGYIYSGEGQELGQFWAKLNVGNTKLQKVSSNTSITGLLDPFVIMKNVKDAESLAIDILTFLTGISSRDGEKFPVLRKAVRSVTQSDSRGLLHVIDELRREDTPISRNIADHIDSFTDYDFAHLLFSDGTVENAISLDNQLNIIQVADLVLPDKDTTFEEYTTIELLSVSMLIVISTFALDFIHSDRSIFKIVDLDEAWAFLNVAQGETLSNKLVRAGRAMQAGVYFVTQSSGDVAKESLKNNIGLKFAFRSTDINEIKQTLEFFGIDKDDENNQKRLRDLENGQCLLQDLYGRVGVVQIHPVFEELLHAFDTRPPVQRNEVE